MRRFGLGATLALFVLSGNALAASPTSVVIDSHITPVVRQFTSKTTPSTLAVNLDFSTADGSFAAPLTQVVLNFSYGAHLNGNLFPSCTADRIRNHKPCPRGSLIGTGSGVGSLADAIENITLKLYNGPKGKSIVFLIHGERPAVIDIPFDAPLKTFSSGLYNYGLTVPVPDALQRIAGIDVSLHSLKVKVDATRVVKGRKRGYIETLICPPGALVPLGASFNFLEAPDFHQDTYIHCGA